MEDASGSKNVQHRKAQPAASTRKGRICAAVACSLLLPALAGCASLIDREPEWVRNPKTAYPENRFLTAVGEGDTRRAAENTAAANLSRIFESHITSDERVVDNVSETEQEFRRTTEMTSDINILSSQTLINIQHAEAWQDEDGRCYAVAYLDRRETAAIYREQVDKKSARAQSLIMAAGQTGDPLQHYARLRAALRAAGDAERMLQQLRIIHPPTASAAAPPYSLHDLRQELAESARRILVRIDLDGDAEGQMTNGLQELVTHYGFVIGEPAVLSMAGSVSITDTGLRTAGLAFYRYSLAVQVSDATGRVLTTIHSKGREAVESAQRARARCFRTMEKAVHTQGPRNLDHLFEALAEQDQ